MSYSPLLPVHIAGGIIGIASGAAAIAFRKGGPRHALAGRVFVGAMLVNAAAAVYLAVLKHEPNNIGGGLMSFYLILTAWLTARRADGQTEAYDWFALLVPAVLGTLSWMNGIRHVRAGQMFDNGVPVGMHFFMGTVMLFAAVGDVRMLLRGGVSGAKRIVRHLWRMCFGLFIAAGSFFLGQQQVFPKVLQGSLLLTILGILPLPILIFWLFRFRFANAYRSWRQAAPART